MIDSPDPNDAPRTPRLSKKALAIITACTAIGLVGGYFYGQRIPYLWKIESKLLMQIGRETGSARPDVIGSGNSGHVMLVPRAEEINTEVELLKSPEIVRATLESMRDEIPGLNPANEGERKAERGGGGLMATLYAGLGSLTEALDMRYTPDREDAIIAGWGSLIQVQPIAKSSIIEVRCLAANKELGKKFLERFLVKYEEAHVQAYRQETSHLFESEVENARNDFANAEGALAQLRLDSGIIDIDQTRQLVLQRREALSSRLRELEGQEAAETARIAEIRKLIDPTGGEVAEMTLSQTGKQNNLTRDYIERMLVDIEREVIENEGLYQDTEVWVTRAQEKRDRLLQLLDKTSPQRMHNEIVSRNPVWVTLKQDETRAVAELHAVRAERADMQSSLNELDERLRKIEQTRLRHDELQINLDEARTSLGQMMAAARIGRVNEKLDNARVTNVRVVSPPTVPATPNRLLGFNHRVAYTMGGAGLGLFISLGLFLLHTALIEGGHLAGRRRRPLDPRELPAEAATRGARRKSDTAS